MTDLASIVFADEGEILRGRDDPDLSYNQLIRPWKSRLGLLYVDASYSVLRDIKIIVLTVLNGISRPSALRGVKKLAADLGASEELTQVVQRTGPLLRAPPPGATKVVSKRETPGEPGLPSLRV